MVVRQTQSIATVEASQDILMEVVAFVAAIAIAVTEEVVVATVIVRAAFVVMSHIVPSEGILANLLHYSMAS